MGRYRHPQLSPNRAFLYNKYLAALATTVLSLAAPASGAQSQSSNPPICLNLQNCTNVDAWGLQVEVGTSGSARQSLCLVPSTVVNATYVLGTEICNGQNSNKTCQASHGGTLDYASLQNFTVRDTSKLDTGVEGFWNSLNGPVEKFGNVEFALAGFTQLNDFEIGIVTNGTNFNVGQLGISPNSTFLKALKDQGYIDRLVFGFDAGSQSPYNPRPGHLVLGGYDQSRVVGNFAEFDINYDDDTEFRPCPFRVGIQKIDLKFDKDSETAPFIDMEANNPYACIEPYDNLFRFPSARLLSLDSLGLKNGKVASDWLPDLQINEPGLRYSAGSPPPFSLSIVLNGNDEDLSIVIPKEELEHPLRGINPNGTYAVNNNYTELNVFQDPAVRNTIVFGKAFLSQVYLAVDYEARKFYLATSSSSTTGCNPVPFQSPNGGGGGGGRKMSRGELAGYIGLGFGVAAFLILVGLLGACLWLWKTGRLDRYRRRGVNITERDIDFGGYMQKNTKDMRDLARQASKQT
ncbi:hypothetical protein Dda_1307 [Drechslerella dactyloides]|uniref:Peptidase A1 domain-containing protein n=1 Tax=Drechslerella dactyloides TaxID=74499 RepID=A0AAD6NLV8_DREDA|nr:hypothetical protein Dda_1307 [Drechslerella dactyloides]